MKTYTVLAGLFLLAAPTVHAQSRLAADVDSKVLRFGVYVAPTLSWMKPTTDKTSDGLYQPENKGSKIGFTYGLMAEYKFADNYILVSGLQLNATGGKINSEYLGGEQTSVVTKADFSYKLNYLEIPVALKLRTDMIQGFRFFGQFGITTGFNLIKKGNYTVDYLDANGKAQVATGENEKIKGTLAIAPVMFSMNIGAGIEYPFTSKLSGYAGLFFNNGFAPDATNPAKYKMSYGLPFEDANTRLNNLALRIGMYF